MKNRCKYTQTRRIIDERSEVGDKGEEGEEEGEGNRGMFTLVFKKFQGESI